MRNIKLKYKFWLVNAVVLILLCLLVLFSMRQDFKQLYHAADEYASAQLQFASQLSPGMPTPQGLLGFDARNQLQAGILHDQELLRAIRHALQKGLVEPGQEDAYVLGSAWQLSEMYLLRADSAPDGKLWVSYQPLHALSQIFVDSAPTYALVVTVLMLIQFVFSQMLISFVERRVTRLRNVMVKVRESGDLNARVVIDSADEVGQVALAFNAMQDSNREIVKSVRDVASQLNFAARQLAHAAQQTEQEMASQLQETIAIVSAMSQMTDVAAELARNAVLMQDQSEEAVNKAASGDNAVQLSRDSIQLLSKDIKEAASLVAQLKENALNINSTTNEIKEISDQTNLLALNAAIEAARAGESGRGFAVVADEVRNLARHAHESSEKIQFVVNAIQDATENIGRVMKQGVSSADQSVQVSSQVVALFSQIREQVDAIKSSNLMVAAAAEEESQTVLTVNQNLCTIEKGSEAARARAAEVAQSAANMRHLASELEEIVRQMKV